MTDARCESFLRLRECASGLVTVSWTSCVLCPNFIAIQSRQCEEIVRNILKLISSSNSVPNVYLTVADIRIVSHLQRKTCKTSPYIHRIGTKLHTPEDSLAWPRLSKSQHYKTALTVFDDHVWSEVSCCCGPSLWLSTMAYGLRRHSGTPSGIPPPSVET